MWPSLNGYSSGWRSEASSLQRRRPSIEDYSLAELVGLIRWIESDDIEAKDLIVGGGIASTDDSQFLKQKGAMVCAGVKQAAEELKARIRNDLKLPDASA